MSRLPPLGHIYDCIVPKLVEILENDDAQLQVNALQVLTELCHGDANVKANQKELFLRLFHLLSKIANKDNPELLSASCALLRNLSASLRPRFVISIL